MADLRSSRFVVGIEELQTKIESFTEDLEAAAKVGEVTVEADIRRALRKLHASLFWLLSTLAKNQQPPSSNADTGG
jgi:cob(I)alamin adenosyltransferase